MLLSRLTFWNTVMYDSEFRKAFFDVHCWISTRGATFSSARTSANVSPATRSTCSTDSNTACMPTKLALTCLYKCSKYMCKKRIATRTPSHIEQMVFAILLLHRAKLLRRQHRQPDVRHNVLRHARHWLAQDDLWRHKNNTTSVCVCVTRLSLSEHWANMDYARAVRQDCLLKLSIWTILCFYVLSWRLPIHGQLEAHRARQWWDHWTEEWRPVPSRTAPGNPSPGTLSASR